MKKLSVFVAENKTRGRYCRWGSLRYSELRFLPKGWYDVTEIEDEGKILLAWNLAYKNENGKPEQWQPSDKYLYWCKKEDVEKRGRFTEW